MADVRELLFADQPLDELLMDIEFSPDSKLYLARALLWEGRVEEAEKAAAGDPPWAPFVVALAKERAGKRDEAVEALLELAEGEDVESRVRLWAWHALRQMGEQPEGARASEVLGVVVEVPMENGFDTLAAYADGRVRYINFAGSVIVVEAEGSADPLVLDLLRRATFLASRPPLPRDPSPPPSDTVRMHALTRRGIHTAEASWAEIERPNEPQADLFNAAGRLLADVTRRAGR